jgi:hypothetical protein
MLNGDLLGGHNVVDKPRMLGKYGKLNGPGLVGRYGMLKQARRVG